MGALRWAAYTIAGGVALTLAFWYLQPDVEIERNTVAVLNQVEGESLAIDVPVENYASVLQDFTLRAEIRNYRGKRIGQTDAVNYEPGMNYKFVTNRNMTGGRYEAHVIVGYQLNPLRASELDFPLAVIYVEPHHDQQ